MIHCENIILVLLPDSGYHDQLVCKYISVKRK
jgi:hypothetical protein